MNFNTLIRELTVYKNFEKDILNNRLSQAYLFSCSDSFTNKILLTQIAKLLMCEKGSVCDHCSSCAKINANTHPDLLIYPQNKSFMVDDASSIYDKVQVKPMLSDYKIFIINDIDNSTEQAQNKMLKIIEEPPKNVIFLLSCTNEENVLPTIMSRVQKKQVNRFKTETLRGIINTSDEELINTAICFGDGYIGKTLDVLNNETFLQSFKNMKSLIKNMKKSDQIPIFSAFFNKDKFVFENNLLILSDFFRDMLMLHFGKEEIVKHKNLINLYYELMPEYSASALNQILIRLNKYNEMLNRNVGLLILSDNLLLEILEVKYLCK